MEKSKKSRSIMQDNKVKVWYSNHTMDGKITVSYSKGQDLIIQGDKEKAELYESN